MLTVCCVLVDGPVTGFNVEYVVRLERMVRRYVPRPFRFVCLTDGTRGEIPAETIRIPRVDRRVPDATKGIWQKVQVFNSAHGFEGRVVFLDLDVIVVSDLSDLIDCEASFAITQDVPMNRVLPDVDRYGRRVVREVNSSVMIWDAGRLTDLYDSWTPAVAEYFSTDQDWIGAKAINGELPRDTVVMDYRFFPRISQGRPPWPSEAKVILVKKPKNHEAVQQWPELNAWWGGWAE